MIAAQDFFTGVFETALEPGEILTEIRVPKADGGVYLKFNRRAQDWATVAVAAVRVGGATQVAFAAMGPVPMRAKGVEEALAGGADPATAAERAAEGTEPPTDVAGTSEYRAELAKVLTRRALEQVA